ncbi:hypothetical protein RE428_13350 [Marinobacter nanhaiticus D15-8W]|nr:hypothetical protein RE428_13350 [Marinobacter nanhaiticus D15-8W]
MKGESKGPSTFLIYKNRAQGATDPLIGHGTSESLSSDVAVQSYEIGSCTDYLLKSWQSVSF